jgi:hypothetical protein
VTDDSGVNMIPDGERLPPGDLRPTPADRCHWCGGSLPEGGGRGSPRRFCCGSHRTAFHSALRRAANLMIDDGRLSVADLHASRKACTLAPVVNSGGVATTLPGRSPHAPTSPIRILWAKHASGETDE